MQRPEHHRSDQTRDLHQGRAYAPAVMLDALANRVRRLRPDHRDPERFHIEKSEIEHHLRQIAAEVR